VNSITGNGNVESEIREIDSFHAIEASSGLKVFVEFGEMSSELEVVADENLLEYISTEVDNGVLKIKSQRNIRRAASKDVFVKAGEIDKINVSSAADIIGENLLYTDKLRIGVSSAGDLELELQADDIRVEVSSSGSATLRGDARQLFVNASSAGNLNAFDLIVEHADVNVSSAADAKVHATKSIDADASSAGNVRYRGNPESKNISSSSAGSISGD
jgi:hypothetical protein